MNTFRVKNFESFQHYKDRSPPWIKLYNELLDDYDFGLLPDATKMHLVAIWLLASRSENKIPYDSIWVAKRINATEPVNLRLLEQKGFILLDQPVQSVEHDASKTLAKCLSRERGETETEERREDAEAKASAPIVASIDGEITEAAVYRFGETLLGQNAGGQITKLRKMFKNDPHKVYDVLVQAQQKGNARRWIAGVLKGSEFAEPTADEICPPDVYENVL